MQKTALIVGRFQPFHKGHLFLIKKALEEADKIIIGIGSANIGNEDNPIDYETRKKIIKAVFYKEKIEERLIKIVPLNDFFDDKKWLANLKEQVGNFDIALGNNDWTNNILKKAGYRVLKVDYYKRPLYEGWRIRKLIKKGKDWQSRVPDYLIKAITDYGLKMTNFQHVVLGGTFDHFHAGHKALLKKAFEVGKKVTIGIATEELYKNKLLPETIDSFEERNKTVKKFVKKYFIHDREIDVISFSEFTGGADKKKNIDAIVVSKDTYKNALKINQLRLQNKLPILKIITVDDVLAEDGELISSERIRMGKIDKEGKKYQISNIKNQKEIKMPENLRPTLQKPLGKVYKTTKQLLQSIKRLKCPFIIGVGDIIVDSLLKEGMDPDVKVIDFKSRRVRTDLFAKLKHVQKGPSLNNNPGTINLKAAERLRDLIRTAMSFPRRRESSDSWLVVDGEEDLLTLPAILFAPLNSLVLYGHWKLGIIAVEVDEKIKDKIMEIIKKFN
ncbi:MAG: pantetheine-phosphate adenylyltransferase [Patescibacteria group bacterium]|jgi:pantetheine-phosphate adenylyltransferase